MASPMDSDALFAMLESNNVEKAQEIKTLLHENLSANPKDSWLLYGLVDYYLNTNSSRVVDVLVQVREPHDKRLFDKLCDCVKNVSTRVTALNLLGQIISKQPSWLYKIANHSLLSALLKILKTENDVTILFPSLLNLVNLLPAIPALISPNLNTIFDIFSRLAAWNRSRAANIPEIYVTYLHTAVYALFHRLYGMYPCNFLCYLRAHYSNRENLMDFNETIKPMLDRVRMHPFLVIASKDSELSTSRWRHQETHDIVVECAKVSLDIVEGVQSDLNVRPYSYGSFSIDESNDVSNTFVPGGQTLNFIAISGQAAICQTEETTQLKSKLTTQSISSMTINKENMAAIESFPSFIDSQPSSPLRKMSSPIKFPPCAEGEDTLYIKKDLFKSSTCQALTFSDVVADEKSNSTKFTNSLSKCSDLGENQQTISEDHFSDCDKEVYEIVNTGTIKLNSYSVENFGKEEQHSERFGQRNDSVIDDETERLSAVEYEGCANPAFNRVVELVHTERRFRYYSQCGPPPDIAELIPTKCQLHRSHSCPMIASTYKKPLKSCELNIAPIADLSSSQSSNVRDVSGDENTRATSSNCEKLNNKRNVSWVFPFSFQTVPLPASCCYQCQKCRDLGASLLEITPNELLDRHITLGTGVDKTTDCTRSTGGSTNSNQVGILKGQILLLHNQLEFERHRRRVHSERNRSVLAKFKKLLAVQEQKIVARDQLKFHEKDIQTVSAEYSQLSIAKSQLVHDKHEQMSLLTADNRKLTAENEALKIELKQIQGSLVEHEEQNETKQKDLANCQAKLRTATLELEEMKMKLADNTKIQIELDRVKKELLLLGELQQKYREKFTSLSHPTCGDAEAACLVKSCKAELHGMKKTLDSRNQQVDVLKARVTELESQLNKKELVVNEQKNLLQSTREEYDQLIECLEYKNHESRSMICQLLSYILTRISVLPESLRGYSVQNIQDDCETEPGFSITGVLSQLDNDAELDSDTKNYIKQHLDSLSQAYS